MEHPLFMLGMAAGVVAIALAARFAAGAWRRRRLGRERRCGTERRRTDDLVPMDRRRGERRG